MKAKKVITRRDFIKQTSVAAIGSSLFLSHTNSLLSYEGKKSRVVLVRNKDVLNENGKPREEVVLEMLDAALKELCGKKDAAEAWQSIIKPDDVVGIKSNVWQFIPTTAEVENAFKKRVMDAGVKEEDIGIDDRGVLRNPVFKRSTALINCRPMRSHHWSGVGSLIKNYITFVPDPYNYHDDSCGRLGVIWDNPLCKGKTRLNVLGMLTPQFHSAGPHAFNPRYVSNYYGFLVGFDVVAVDSTGLRIIQALRNEYYGEERPLSPPAKHIFLADTRYKLGTADPNKIEIVKIGYDVDSYI